MPPPSGTVTFLFTDIEGSTQLWESAPDAMQVALERHDELARAAIEAHGGYVFATGGDGFCVAFGRAAEALSAAVEFQEALAGERWPDGAVVRVRMGVHTGEAAERGGDYFGPAVNRAGRLMSTAHGGQVVCSRSTAAVVGDGFALQSLGEHRLRDLAAAEAVFQVGDGEHPPLRSVDVVPTNLPTMRTELIGRSDDVATLSDLVVRERLVTLTGTGGVGKTRLALAVAASSTAGFPDGCWLVELSPVDDGDELVKAVAAAMGAQAMTAKAVGEYLADRRALVVLDNCEHVLDDAADLVDAALAVAPELHVLTTSREPLGLDGEQVRRVQSLGLPATGSAPEEARLAAAVRLFEERAASGGEFALDDENTDVVVEICRKLDGIPLAIELAAARVRAMAPKEIAARLDERFRLLAGGSRRSQERHRTLQAAVSWSHDLLTDDEKVVFRRLAAFPGSFDLAAVEAVADAPEIDVVDCLLRLVDRSLVLYDPEVDRYRLLETLRQYGADRLADAAETDVTRELHARYFLGSVEQLKPALRDERYADAFQAVAVELENLRSAADWCIDEERWPDLAGLARNGVWALVQSAPVDLCAWYQQALDHASALDAQVTVDVLGHFAWAKVSTLGVFVEGEEMAARSNDLAAEHDLLESGWAWAAQCMAASNTGRLSEASDRGTQALRAAEARADPLLEALALTLQIAPVAWMGDRERAERLTEDALERASRIGHQNAISSVIIAAANAKLSGDAGDVAASLDLLTTHPVEPTGHLNTLWLDVTWGVALVDQDPPRAARHLVRAVRRADQLGTPAPLDQAFQVLAIAMLTLGRMDFAEALATYTDANYSAYRIDSATIAWNRESLDAALPDGGSESPPTRREVMAIVAEIERQVAHVDLPGATY